MLTGLWHLETILTFFPSHHAVPNDQRIPDLYNSIYGNLARFKTADSIYGIWSYIAKTSATLLISQEGANVVNFLDTYRWAAGIKVGRRCDIPSCSKLVF